MTIKEIIEKYLKENNYDGICNTYFECGCDKDDLFPCGEYCGDCEPAYLRKCINCEKNNSCEIKYTYDIIECYNIKK